MTNGIYLRYCPTEAVLITNCIFGVPQNVKEVL